jgi:DNA-binding transcriptional LysR family regulator
LSAFDQSAPIVDGVDFDRPLVRVDRSLDACNHSYVKLSQVDLNLLVTLDAIIKERSVTRAGRTVGLSQSAMSAALARLRSLLGDPLLERVGREYRLTPLALRLAAPVQSILVSIERTLDRDVAFDPETAQCSFRIAGSDYVACTMFQLLVEHMSRVAPGVQLRFMHAGNSTPRHLNNREIDLAIQPSDNHRDFEKQELWRDQFVCVAWKGNTLIQEQLTQELFCSLGHVTYSHPPFGYMLADHFVGAIARQLRVQVMTDSFVNIPFLLRGTNLISLLQLRLARQLEAAADIRLFPCPVPLRELKISMWWNALYDNDPAHLWLRRTIAELARTNELASAAETAQ